jgi:hypothetical protein
MYITNKFSRAISSYIGEEKNNMIMMIMAVMMMMIRRTGT